MGFFSPPLFLSRTILYSGLENLELKHLAQGKDKQKLHGMHVFGGGGRGEEGVPCLLSL